MVRSRWFREEEYPHEAQVRGFMPAYYPAPKKVTSKGYPIRNAIRRYLLRHPKLVNAIQGRSKAGLHAVPWEGARIEAINKHRERAKRIGRGRPIEDTEHKRAGDIPF
jgi:hypothetical protein